MNTDEQLAEMESWLIGCVNALCSDDCGSYLLDPGRHIDTCPYKKASLSEPEGWVGVDKIVNHAMSYHDPS